METDLSLIKNDISLIKGGTLIYLSLIKDGNLIYVCISYNTGKSALPDIYARHPRASTYISGKARVPVL